MDYLDYTGKPVFVKKKHLGYLVTGPELGMYIVAFPKRTQYKPSGKWSGDVYYQFVDECLDIDPDLKHAYVVREDWVELINNTLGLKKYLKLRGLYAGFSSR